MAEPGGDEAEWRRRVRRHLTVIQAQTELLADTATEPSEAHHEALQTILRSTHRLSATLDGATGTAAVGTAPEAAEPESIRRLLVVSSNPYLERLLTDHPTYHGGLELLMVDSLEDARAALATDPPDYALIDAVRPEGTGVDLAGRLADLAVPVPPYSLISLYTDDTTPVALALSGVVDPEIGVDAFTASLEPFVDDPAAVDVAGLLGAVPDGALGERITEHPDTIVDDPSAVVERLDPGAMTADVVCLDRAVYEQLPPASLGRLRTIAPGRGRPLLLLSSTAADPYDRDWIPTLGGRQFLTVPPDLVGLLTQLLVPESAPADALP